MKKNFFKKLSFVLALAMIVSVLAPAAGVFAADELELNKSERTLLLGQEGKDDYNFNIVGTKGKGWKYEWSSSDEDVATVASNGVTTAVGVGTADITVDITDKKGEDVASLTAKVTVKNNIKEITEIYMQTKDAPALDKLLANTEYDFGRKFETYGGLTTTTSKTYWTVSSDNATIDKNGVFKATEAGTYTITAYAFQSWAKCDDWKALNDPAATLNVLATKSIDVTVVPSVVKTQQIDLDSFKVVFDTDMSKSDFAANAVLYQVLNDKDITTGAEKVKEVKYDTTGKEVTFDILAEFNANATYKLVSGDFVASFKAADPSIDNVKTIEFNDFNVDVNSATGTSMLSAIKGVNADGVAIKSGADLFAAGTLSFEFKGDLTKGFISGTDCYIYTLGYSTTVVASFSNWVWDDAEKKYVEVKATDTATATGIETDTNLTPDTLSFAINSAETENTTYDITKLAYGNTFSVPAGDPEFYIHYRYKTNDDPDNFKYDTTVPAGYTFKTDNPDKLLVFGNTMVPVATGNAYVLVLNADGKTVTAFTVTVTPARTFVGATADVTAVQLGNSTDPDAAETKTITITGTDSLQDVVDPTITAVEVINAPAGVDKTAVKDLFVQADSIDDSAADKSTLKVYGSKTTDTPEAIPSGAYTLLVTVSASSQGVTFTDTKQVRLSVMVLDASDTTVTRWAPELSVYSIDRKDIIYATAGVDPKVTAGVYGYNAKGARVKKAPETDYEIALSYNGNAFTKNVNANDFLVGEDGTGTWDIYAIGVYTVAFKAIDNNSETPGCQNVFNKADGMIIGYKQLEVKDTTTTACNIKASSVDATTVSDIAGAVLAAFEFKIDNTTINTGTGTFTYYTSDGQHAVAGSDGSGPVTAGSTLYIDRITYEIAQGGSTTYVYTINVKKTIAVK